MYKIILFCLGIFLVSVGKRFRIMHWPYGELIYFSGWALCVAMFALFVYGLLKNKSSKDSSNKKLLFCLGIFLVFVGERFRIMHWPYGKLIYFSGWALCIAMIALIIYGMLKKRT